MPRPIATLDTETDPFLFNRIPSPFCADFFDGERHVTTWGADCIEKIVPHLKKFDGIIYAHNGGRFDWFFFLPYMDDYTDIMFIGNRIVKMKFGKAELRDSYSILPVALKYSGMKLEFDYEKCEADVRESYKDEILEYLKQDTKGLYDWINDFIDRFGLGLTLAGRSLAKVKDSGFSYGKMNERADASFRRFYYGGRVQCFESGIIDAPCINYIDINSAYPAVMRNVQHSVTSNFDLVFDLCEGYDQGFWIIDATSKGCLPVRTETGLAFPHERREYYATGHEIRAGLETGTLEIHKVVHGYMPMITENFADFIDEMFAERKACKDAGDENGSLFFKLLMNSAYGRFCIDTRRHKKHKVVPMGEVAEADEISLGKNIKRKVEYELSSEIGDTGLSLWERPAIENIKRFENVTTGASITGAVRAMLWRQICKVDRPLYCDTDSIFFIGPRDCVDIGDKLGQWDVEGRGDRLAVAGKKLYAFRTNQIEGGEHVWKTASKGVKLNHKQILEVANGGEITDENFAPSFSIKKIKKSLDENGSISYLDSIAKFTKRNIRLTA